MASSHSTIGVIFEALDHLSPTLARLHQNFSGFEAGVKAAARATRQWGAVAELSAYASEKVGARFSALGDALSSAAEPLDEARTKFTQIAGAQNLAAASARALALANQYGQGSWSQELDAITRAYALYGNLADAERAVAAATKLATATHADVGATFDALADTARNAGISVDALADKMARFYQVAGAGGAAIDTRQLERALGAAQMKGVSIDRFLAVVEEANKAGLSARDVMEYFQGGKGVRVKAIRQLLASHGAAIDADAAAFGHSRGAADRLAGIAGEDANQRLRRLHQNEASLGAAFGGGVLENEGEIAKFGADLVAWAASFANAHKTFAGAAGTATAALGGMLEKLGEFGQAAVGVRVAYDAYKAWRLAKTAATAAETANAAATVTATTALGAETAAQGRLAAVFSAAGLRATLGGAAGLTAGTAVGAVVAGGAGIIAGHEIYKHAIAGSREESWLARHLHDTHSAVHLRKWNGPRELHVTGGGVTINVHVPHGASAKDAHELAEEIKAALDKHDTGLAEKIARAVDREHDDHRRRSFHDPRVR